MNKKTAIVLGGTIPHKYLIDNLKERGFYTILIDYHENPPAASAADEHIQESTLDKETVLKIALERKVSLVISGCVDQANTTACYVLEKLGLYSPYTYETSLRVTDKELMKEGMNRAAIPSAKYDLLTADNYKTYRSELFPKVVKPCDANGSKGVRKVTNETELSKAIEQAINISRTKKAIVEDYKNGTEINAYCFIDYEKKAKVLFIKSKRLPNIDKKSALQSFFSLGPYNASPIVNEKIKKTTEIIAEEFNLVNTPILIQAIIEKDDVYIIEFAPRVGGGLAFREIEHHTGFDMIDAVIDSYMGNKISQNKSQATSHLSSVTHFFGTSGNLENVEGLDELVKSNIIKEYHLHKTKGMAITSEDLASQNRIFGVIVLGENIQEIKDKLDKVVKGVKVINSNGENVFLKVSFDELI